jgi:4-amino-4-deoxy-L-arabinose transferase-like glycosyltransferase
VKLATSTQRKICAAAVISLLIVLVLELALSVRRETQTWDEACHIFAGYSYWTRGDFAMNPEHPPLVKLLATAPLLTLSLKVPPPRKDLFSKEEDFTSGTQFIYGNNADQIMFRVRMAAALITLLLAVMLFSAAREMFGTMAAFIALVLFVFEPNILAHGAVVATDMAVSCFLFATVYAFYRYVKKPSWGRLALVGVANGLALGSKHSAILVFPILIALAIVELWLCRKSIAGARDAARPGALKLTGALVLMGIIAVGVLWAAYGFRLHPLPGADAEPRVVEYARGLQHPLERDLITEAARWHVLPEAYLYGLADVGYVAEFSHSYLFGHVYPHGQWFYFPAAFLIKTMLTLLVLLLLVPFAMVFRGAKYRRELAFLIIPAVIYFAVAMASDLNIGVRHILPVYPFVMVLGAWAAAVLIHSNRKLVYAVAVVLLFGIISSLRVFPVYLAYANELWGGPANTYKYLSDSNADWGQQLKSIKTYLDQRHVKDCWFAYFAAVVADPQYYGIPCKPLTTIASTWLQPSMDVPASIDGPVLISAGVLSGYEFGPDQLNPYEQFTKLHPTAVIDYGVFVYDGHFDIPLASALNHVTQSQLQERAGNMDQALAEAQTAVQLAPDSLQTQARLGFVLLKLGRRGEGRQALQRALTIAQTIKPELQSSWTVASVRAALGQ